MNASAVAATRLVLVGKDRPTPRPAHPDVRHYRLARARVATLRAPKHAHLGRTHD